MLCAAFSYQRVQQKTYFTIVSQTALRSFTDALKALPKSKANSVLALNRDLSVFVAVHPPVEFYQ